MALDVYSWARNCDEMVEGSDRIVSMLRNPGFIHRMRTRLTSNLGDTPEFGILMNFLTWLLNNDKEFERAVKREVNPGFVRSSEYPWFCFWCSIIIYDNIRNQISVRGSGHIV